MPMFDLQCKKCKNIREDVWLSVYTDKVVLFDDKCRNCRCKVFEVMAPLTAMQPDNMWSGQNTKFGYFTSKSQYEQSLKDRNLVTIDKKELDSTRKKVYNTRQDNKRKQAQATNDFLNQQLASVEISPDGNTVKERNKYARKRQ
jgi:hypothetical protein